jgi:CheY-specific phosphatase CheX
VRWVETGLEERCHQVVDLVWSTMLGRMVETRDRSDAATDLGARAGVTTFTAWTGLTGAWVGSLHLHCERPAVEAFASWFLSTPPARLKDEDLVDCLAELCNMILGNLKTALPGPTNMGLPAVVLGEDYRLEQPTGRVLLDLPCRAGGHDFAIVVTEQGEL